MMMDERSCLAILASFLYYLFCFSYHALTTKVFLFFSLFISSRSLASQNTFSIRGGEKSFLSPLRFPLTHASLSFILIRPASFEQHVVLFLLVGKTVAAGTFAFQPFSM